MSTATLLLGIGVGIAGLVVLHGLARWAERRARRRDVLQALNQLRPR